MDCLYLFALLNSFLHISCCFLLKKTLMLYGPFDCAGTAVCILCSYSISKHWTWSLSSVLPYCMHMYATEVLNSEKPRLQMLLLRGQPGPVPTAASLSTTSLNASVTLLSLPLTGAVFGSSWSTRPEEKGTRRWGTGRGFAYQGGEYGVFFPWTLWKGESCSSRACLGLCPCCCLDRAENGINLGSCCVGCISLQHRFTGCTEPSTACCRDLKSCCAACSS